MLQFFPSTKLPRQVEQNMTQFDKKYNFCGVRGGGGGGGGGGEGAHWKLVLPKLSLISFLCCVGIPMEHPLRNLSAPRRSTVHWFVFRSLCQGRRGAGIQTLVCCIISANLQLDV